MRTQCSCRFQILLPGRKAAPFRSRGDVFDGIGCGIPVLPGYSGIGHREVPDLDHDVPLPSRSGVYPFLKIFAEIEEDEAEQSDAKPRRKEHPPCAGGEGAEGLGLVEHAAP